MRLFVLHYHLLPGGVTDVIQSSLQALLEARSDINRIELITGLEENAAAVVRGIHDRAGEIPVSFTVWKELGYSDPTESTTEANARAGRIFERLNAVVKTSTDLLWIHNYHLGKNAALTLAVTRFVSSTANGGSGSPRILLHVHDFPEEGRLANLAYLRRICGEVPYPVSARTDYAVINTRDHSVLHASDIPKSRIHYLPNPISPGKVNTADTEHASARRDRVVMALSSYARSEGQRFHEDGPIVLYPVRAIRRKNILELAMICRLMPDWNLVVTLPGTSASEKAYSELISYAYSDRRVHGCFGIGRQEHRYGITFDDLFCGSDLIASSSVQEGFGLAFLNTLLARVPLLARRLPTMDGLLPMFERYPTHLYERFLIPLTSPSISSMRGYLRMRYGERTTEIAEAAPEAADDIERMLDAKISAETIDVSFLPAQLQLTVLGDLRDDGFAAEVRALNGDLLDAARQLVGTSCPDVSERVASSFGYSAFAEHFAGIIERPNGPIADTEPGAHKPHSQSAAASMARSLLGMEQARLLLGPLDHE